MLQLELAGVTLLFAPAGDGAGPLVAADKTLGVYHIAFLVQDCDAATDFTQRGAEVAVPPKFYAKNIKASFLSAPDGMWLELKEIVPHHRLERS